MNIAADQRWIMVKAPDDHIVGQDDSIDEWCLSHRGMLMAPNLACNVPGAVGRLAGQYKAVGRQVWRGQWMTVRNGKIIREAA